MKTFYLILGLVIIAFGIWFGVIHPVKAPTNDSNDVSNQQPEITYVNSSADMIVPELPFPGAVTGKEFGVLGKARGNWYFEGSFPIEVLDQNGSKIAVGYATAQGEWMTTEFVSFKGQIKVPDTYIGPATLILHKDNPSGEPQFDASISFPITIEY